VTRGGKLAHVGKMGRKLPQRPGSFGNFSSWLKKGHAGGREGDTQTPDEGIHREGHGPGSTWIPLLLKRQGEKRPHQRILKRNEGKSKKSSLVRDNPGVVKGGEGGKQNEQMKRS